MSIMIHPFEDISKINLLDMMKESPLVNYEISEKVFHKEEDVFMLDNWDLDHWHRLLKNKVISLNRNFGYAMFYYYRGIPDDPYYISPGGTGKSVEFFPYFEEKHYSNHHNFTYFVDVFFLQAFTVYETLGHLLFKYYDFEDKNGRISYNKAVSKLKKVNFPLYEALNSIMGTDNFKLGHKLRNNIAHNHPPHRLDSGVTKFEGGEAFGVGRYTKSDEIKRMMIGYLKSIKLTLDSFEKYLTPQKP